MPIVAPGAAAADVALALARARRAAAASGERCRLAAGGGGVPGEAASYWRKFNLKRMPEDCGAVPFD